MNYKAAYALLVETASNAIDEIEKANTISKSTEKAIRILKEGLEEAEDMYICAED